MNSKIINCHRNTEKRLRKWSEPRSHLSIVNQVHVLDINSLDMCNLHTSFQSKSNKEEKSRLTVVGTESDVSSVLH